MARELNTIQKREKLNTVIAVDEPGNGGANHEYLIKADIHVVPNTSEVLERMECVIKFQNGPRKDPNSEAGILDSDLLEIVRDRLKGFQAGEFATDCNAQALLHIEEALMWMNRRVEDRIERQVLGTNNQ